MPRVEFPVAALSSARWVVAATPEAVDVQQA